MAKVKRNPAPVALDAERDALEKAYLALQEIAPLVDRMNAIEDEETRVAHLLERFTTVVERRILCRRCGARVTSTALICRVCGTPMRGARG